MKILVIAESLRINETSSGIVSSTFLKALSENKRNEIICLYHKVFEYNITWLDAVKFIEIEKKVYKGNKIIDGVPKLRGLLTNIVGIHNKTNHEIKRWKNSINKVLSTNKIDLIVTLGSGAEFHPNYAMLKVKTKITWLANFHDPYPFSVYPKPYQKKRTHLLKRQEFFTKRMIYKANYVSFPSLYLKDLMQSTYGFSNNKSIILPHVGLALTKLPTKSIDDKISLPEGRFNLLHAGTLLGPRKVDALFNAFVRFINSDKEKKEFAILNVLGNVAKDNLEIISKHQLLKNINVILDRASYKKSLELTSQANVSIIVEANADFSPFMPGKLADLIFLEKPILALTPKISETIRILGENYPYQARVNDEKQILEKLELLWRDWKSEKLNLPNAFQLKNYISSEEFNKKINTL